MSAEAPMVPGAGAGAGAVAGEPRAGETGHEPGAADRVWLKVTHDTFYNYDGPVELAHHMAHLSPRETPSQQVRGWRLTIDPPPDEWLQGRPLDDGGVPQGQASLDCWGNRRVAFSHARVHERLQVRSSFEAGILPTAPPDAANSPPWE